MRITNNTMNNTFLNNLNKNLRKMMKAQEQATTGKAVSRPSDNPLLVGKILSMKDNIQQNEQYNTNINNALGWVKTQDTALNDAGKTMNQIRDNIIYGANGSLSETDRLAIRDEVVESIGELKDILNTNFDGRYIFAGQKTDKPPFIEEEIFESPGVSFDPKKFELTYNGNDKNIKREIAQGVTIELRTDGGDITKIEGGEDLGNFLNEVVKALESGDQKELDKLSGEHLDKADKFIDKLLQTRSKIGATHNRLEAAEERNKSENINLSGVLSEKEDVDLAESYMNYIMMTTAYQSSLSMGAKILQPSLMDYLR
ncbi:MAG: flagellar hook-associated protein FlgL [Tissierella sp.]|uniref:flagellar hook-associated protein FlgL n=1 Tax=Tissierella sp. TaxID=41274 RepID=UPI003F970681